MLSSTRLVRIVDGRNLSNRSHILWGETVFDRSSEHEVLIPRVGFEIRPDRVRARHVCRRQDLSALGLNFDDLPNVATPKTLCVVKLRFLRGGDLIDRTPDDICCNPGVERVALAGPVSETNLVKTQDVGSQLGGSHDYRRRRSFTKPSRTQIGAVGEVLHPIPLSTGCLGTCAAGNST